MATGRYKLGPDGTYLDPNDTGPDQASPDQIQQFQQSQQSQQPAQSSSQPYPSTTGGLEDKLMSMSDQGASNYPTVPGQDFQSSEGEGGITGKAQTGMQIDQQQPPSTSGSLPSPYMGSAPANNPGAAPELGYYGADQNAHSEVYTPEKANFDNYFQNYWAPDRAQVLASMRQGAQQKQVGSSQTPAAAANTPVPNGFDAGKWNDPNKKDPKYDAGHMLAAGKSLEEIGNYLQQTYPGYKYLGGDKMQGPDGYTYDFSFGSKAGINQPQWTQVGGPDGSSGQSSIGAGAGAGGDAALYGGGTSGFGGLSGDFGGGQLGDAIARLLGRGEAGASPTNPNIAGPTAAYRATVERAGRRNRNAMAERYAAEGLNPGGAGSGAFDSAVQSEGESEGQNVANYQGKLITDEIAAQRQDVVNALQFAQGQERLWLQQYLAILNDKLQRAQMGQQNQQFYDTMGYNMGRDAADLDAKLYGYLQ